jgi:hypothetical protein
MTAKFEDKKNIDRRGPRPLANVCHLPTSLASHYRLPLIICISNKKQLLSCTMYIFQEINTGNLKTKLQALATPSPSGTEAKQSPKNNPIIT